MFETVAALRHSPVEEQGLAEPATHKMGSGTLKKFGKGVGKLLSVELSYDIAVERHLHFENHCLGGGSGGVWVHTGVELEFGGSLAH